MKILIAIEDKVFGQAIADFVSQHEWGKDAEFRLIHVIDLFSFCAYPGDLIESLMEEQQRAGKSLVMQIGTAIVKSIPGVSIKEEVLKGSPKSVIIQEAKEWPADLIIVGSHGRSGIGQFLLGSVSMSVLSAAPCSVMVVKLPQKNENLSSQEKQAITNK